MTTDKSLNMCKPLKVYFDKSVSRETQEFIRNAILAKLLRDDIYARGEMFDTAQDLQGHNQLELSAHVLSGKAIANGAILTYGGVGGVFLNAVLDSCYDAEKTCIKPVKFHIDQYTNLLFTSADAEVA